MDFLGIGFLSKDRRQFSQCIGSLSNRLLTSNAFHYQKGIP